MAFKREMPGRSQAAAGCLSGAAPERERSVRRLAGTQPESDEALREPGTALDAAAVAWAAPQCSRDFSRVRVHGPAAAVAVRAPGARTFTAGEHVVFGASSFAQRLSLQRLPAHKTAHVAPLYQGRTSSDPALGSPDDALEREADATAERVMRMSAPAALGSAPIGIQRKCAACEEEQQGAIQARFTPAGPGATAADTAAAARAASSGGEPLPPALRAYFEPRFGYDFGAVRLHTGDEAARAAQSIQARAYTLGRDIVFGAGHYSPATATGQRLLAHELTHVVQQTSASGAPRLQRDADKTCSKRQPLYGWDNIRNISRERLRAAGFVFCGPDRDFGDPELWERWVHPTKGVLHFQVKWKDNEPEKEDCQKKYVDPCMDQTDDEESCLKCCKEKVPDGSPCRNACDYECIANKP